jgi:hypothetical protein
MAEATATLRILSTNKHTAKVCAGVALLDSGSGGVERPFTGLVPPSCSPAVTYVVTFTEGSGGVLRVNSWLAEPCTVAADFYEQPLAFVSTRASTEMKGFLRATLKSKCNGAHHEAAALQLLLGKGVAVLPATQRKEDRANADACRTLFDMLHVALAPDLWALYVRAYEVVGRAAAALASSRAALTTLVAEPRAVLFPTACMAQNLQNVDFGCSPSRALAAASAAQPAWRALRTYAAFGNVVTAEHVIAEYGAPVLRLLHDHDLFTKLLEFAQRYRELSAAPPSMQLLPAVDLDALDVVDCYQLQQLEPTTFRSDAATAGFPTWFSARAGVCRQSPRRSKCFAVHETHGLVYVQSIQDNDVAVTSEGAAVSAAGLTYVCQVPVDLAHACFEPRSLAAIGLYSTSTQQPELSWNRETLTRALQFVRPGGRVYVWGRFGKLKALLAE